MRCDSNAAAAAAAATDSETRNVTRCALDEKRRSVKGRKCHVDYVGASPDRRKDVSRRSCGYDRRSERNLFDQHRAQWVSGSSSPSPSGPPGKKSLPVTLEISCNSGVFLAFQPMKTA